MLLYASTRLCYVMSGISYEHFTHKLDTRSMFFYHTLCICSEKDFLGLFLIRFQSMSAYWIYFSYVSIRWLKRYGVTGP